jgi:hypothetical protein
MKYMLLSLLTRYQLINLLVVFAPVWILPNYYGLDIRVEGLRRHRHPVPCRTQLTTVNVLNGSWGIPNVNMVRTRIGLCGFISVEGS